MCNDFLRKAYFSLSTENVFLFQFCIPYSILFKLALTLRVISPGTRYENEGIERTEMRALREALVTLVHFCGQLFIIFDHIPSLEKKQQLGESEQRTLRQEKQELLDALKVN